MALSGALFCVFLFCALMFCVSPSWFLIIMSSQLCTRTLQFADKCILCIADDKATEFAPMLYLYVCVDLFFWSMYVYTRSMLPTYECNYPCELRLD